MGDAPGIAGSRRPEQEGCFLCEDDYYVAWFVRLNNTGGPVDVWAVEGVDEDDLVTSPEGYRYLPRPIPPDKQSLVQRDLPSFHAE